MKVHWRGQREGEAFGGLCRLAAGRSVHRGAIKGERESPGVWGEEPTGWAWSVAGGEKEESGMMSEVPWMGEPLSEEGEC